MSVTKAYIYDLDYKKNIHFKKIVEKDPVLSAIFQKYKLQIIAILHDEIKSLPGCMCYCIYIGASLNHNMMELGYSYFHSEAEVKEYLKQYCIEQLSQWKAEKIANVIKCNVTYQ